jgi:hypothetical protein
VDVAIVAMEPEEALSGTSVNCDLALRRARVEQIEG